MFLIVHVLGVDNTLGLLVLALAAAADNQHSDEDEQGSATDGNADDHPGAETTRTSREWIGARSHGLVTNVGAGDGVVAHVDLGSLVRIGDIHVLIGEDTEELLEELATKQNAVIKVVEVRDCDLALEAACSACTSGRSKGCQWNQHVVVGLRFGERQLELEFSQLSKGIASSRQGADSILLGGASRITHDISEKRRESIVDR